MRSCFRAALEVACRKSLKNANHGTGTNYTGSTWASGRPTSTTSPTPAADRCVFAYTITISNTGMRTVKLINRHWLITGANSRSRKYVAKAWSAKTATYNRAGVPLPVAPCSRHRSAPWKASTENGRRRQRVLHGTDRPLFAGGTAGTALTTAARQMAVYAVGDIQGCHDELAGVLDEIGFDPPPPPLVVRRRPRQSRPQVTRGAALHRGLGDAAVCVLGNHDLHLLRSPPRQPEEPEPAWPRRVSTQRTATNCCTGCATARWPPRCRPRLS